MFSERIADTAFHDRANSMTSAQVANLLRSHSELQNNHKKLEQEVVHLRHQIAWFQRQLFGQKSEKRIVELSGVQGVLGIAFDDLPTQSEPPKKQRIASYERQTSAKNKPSEDSPLFFDESKVPVETIELANPEISHLSPDDYDVIGEKVSYRLAQRPGSYVVLKYVRPVIKRRDTQIISCPPAPVSVIDGSRADVSFIAGLLVDKFAYHLPFYRQHQRLIDAGFKLRVLN